MQLGCKDSTSEWNESLLSNSRAQPIFSKDKARLTVSLIFRTFASMTIINDATKEFVRCHRLDDVRQLALMGSKTEDIDLTLALQQIQGWQTARTKLPSWAARDEVIYPPHLNMEQCSSEATARYKGKLAARLCPDGGTMADLTGGMGIDFSVLAGQFDRAFYVERNPQLCQLMAHNAPVLGLKGVEIRHGDCTEVLHELPHLTLLFMDPARRDSHGGKVFQLQDCQPDLLQLREELLRQADVVMLKLSPMLDWHAAVQQLGCVREVHIVATGNECKELLLVCAASAVGQEGVYCVNDEQRVCVPMDSEPLSGLRTAMEVKPGNYLYEPNAAVMKASAFGWLCENYGVDALGRDAHLFTSAQLLPNFPGRRFQIRAVSTLNKKELRRQLGGISQANIAVRHFPLSADALRKRLRLRDGGSVYLFATTFQPTTTARPEHIILITEKA